MDVAQREKVADRLLSGSVRKSYEPIVDMDWDAPLDPAKLFLPPEVISLYGTRIWDGMSAEQRRELSRQELANVLSTGIWFENVLNRMLLRELIGDDPTSKHAHYALTEMGDECRHMVMFGRLIDKIGARPYWPQGGFARAIKALPFFLRGSMVFSGALIGEEIFDALQRRMLDSDRLQPLVARMMRIHVTEEARHIRFAREELARDFRNVGRAERTYTRGLVALSGPWFFELLTNKHMYRRAGLDAEECHRAAVRNEHFRATLASGADGLVTFLDGVGLFGPAARKAWGSVGMLR